MGLARKLGNASHAKNPIPGEFAVEYKWSSQSYTLLDILTKFKLPCVVHCDADQCSIDWSDFHFDLRFPLLLYSRRTVRKIHARNLDSATKEETGPAIAIPEDYEGWFGASSNGRSQTKRHTRIQSIADSNTRRFLVCTKCPAFKRSTATDGSVDYVPRDITPGETFKRVCVMDSDFNDQDIPAIILHNGPCLECLDDKDDEVLIPFSRRAIAFEIMENYQYEPHKVFPTKSIFSEGNSQLPRMFSLVYGELPVLEYAFSGDLRCCNIFTEETILAASMDEATPMCLELALDSAVKFKLSLNETAIKRTCEYGNALHLCKTTGDTFLTGMKVSFSVKPETYELDESVTNASDILNISDMQEMDANSEFEIAWNSDLNVDSSASNSTVASIERNKPQVLISNNNDNIRNDIDDYSHNMKIKPSNSKYNHHNVYNEEQNVPDDFTEQEIANLMVRKGMIRGLGASSSSDLNLSEEIETIRKNRSNGNSFCFYNENDKEKCNKINEEDRLVLGNGNNNECERDAEKKAVTLESKHPAKNCDLPENGLSFDSEFSEESGDFEDQDKLSLKTYENRDGSITHLESKENSLTFNTSSLSSSHSQTSAVENSEHFKNKNPIALNYDEDSDSSGTVELSLDETEFMTAVCKPASEYHEGNSYTSSDEDSQGESDIFEKVFQNRSTIVRDACVAEPEFRKKESSVSCPVIPKNNKKNEENKRETINDIGVQCITKTKAESTKDLFVDSSQNELNASLVGLTVSSVEFTPVFEDTDDDLAFKDTGSKKNKGKSKSRSEGNSLLHKFKSDTNVSRLFDRLKGSDSEKRQNVPSSKTKILQMKSSSNDLNNRLISKHDDLNFEGIEC